MIKAWGLTEFVYTGIILTAKTIHR